MSQPSILFVHSPLVGPSSLVRLASMATRSGYEIALPDLTPVADSHSPHELYVRLAADAGRTLNSPLVVVGHSGAGAFLPLISEAIDPAASLVFVDAVVPPRTGVHATPEAMKSMLDDKTVAGTLARWLDWWPEETVSQLVPDPVERAELVGDMPQLARSFYDLDIAMPEGWTERPCAYVRLSGAYEAEVEEAKLRGWSTIELDSTHLATYTEPDRVFAAISELVAKMWPSG